MSTEAWNSPSAWTGVRSGRGVRSSETVVDCGAIKQPQCESLWVKSSYSKGHSPTETSLGLIGSCMVISSNLKLRRKGSSKQVAIVEEAHVCWGITLGSTARLTATAAALSTLAFRDHAGLWERVLCCSVKQAFSFKVPFLDWGFGLLHVPQCCWNIRSVWKWRFLEGWTTLWWVAFLITRIFNAYSLFVRFCCVVIYCFSVLTLWIGISCKDKYFKAQVKWLHEKAWSDLNLYSCTVLHSV